MIARNNTLEDNLLFGVWAGYSRQSSARAGEWRGSFRVEHAFFASRTDRRLRRKTELRFLLALAWDDVTGVYGLRYPSTPDINPSPRLPFLASFINNPHSTSNHSNFSKPNSPTPKLQYV